MLAGPQLKKTIRVLVSWRDFTFAANGHQIAVFNRLSLVKIRAHLSDPLRTEFAISIRQEMQDIGFFFEILLPQVYHPT